MNNDISCPTCGRVDWVQSVPALQSTGTATVSGSDYYSGVGISPSGPVPTFGTVTIERTRTTALAHATAYAPPQRPTTRPLIFGLLLAIPGLVALVAAATVTVGRPDLHNPGALGMIVDAVFGILFAYFCPLLLSPCSQSLRADRVGTAGYRVEVARHTRTMETPTRDDHLEP